MRIDITIVDTVPRGVDTPADLETARGYWRPVSEVRKPLRPLLYELRKQEGR